MNRFLKRVLSLTMCIIFVAFSIGAPIFEMKSNAFFLLDDATVIALGCVLVAVIGSYGVYTNAKVTSDVIMGFFELDSVQIFFEGGTEYIWDVVTFNTVEGKAMIDNTSALWQAAVDYIKDIFNINEDNTGIGQTPPADIIEQLTEPVLETLNGFSVNLLPDNMTPLTMTAEERAGLVSAGSVQYGTGNGVADKVMFGVPSYGEFGSPPSNFLEFGKPANSQNPRWQVNTGVNQYIYEGMNLGQTLVWQNGAKQSYYYPIVYVDGDNRMCLEVWGTAISSSTAPVKQIGGYGQALRIYDLNAYGGSEALRLTDGNIYVDRTTGVDPVLSTGYGYTSMQQFMYDTIIGEFDFLPLTPTAAITTPGIVEVPLKEVEEVLPGNVKTIDSTRTYTENGITYKEICYTLENGDTVVSRTWTDAQGHIITERTVTTQTGTVTTTTDITNAYNTINEYTNNITYEIADPAIPGVIEGVKPVDPVSDRIRLDSNLLLTKFPFSLPFDLYGFVTILNAAPRPLKFTIPLSDWNSFSAYGLNFDDVVIDLSAPGTDFSAVAKIIRYFIGAIFVIGLIILTRKIMM